MKLLIIALLLGFGSVSLAAPIAKEAQFFSGVFLLQFIPGLPNGEKARKFHELELLTGIDARKAEALLSSYGTRPAEGKILCDSMIPMITGLQGKPFPPAVAKNYSPLSGVRR